MIIVRSIVKLSIFILIVLIAGCNEAYDIKMSEIDSPKNQALMREKLSKEDYVLLRHARLRYSISGREKELRRKTIGGLIKEQEKLEELAMDKRLERQKKFSKFIALERSDSSRYINNAYYLETRIRNKGDKSIRTIRFKATIYDNDISEGIIRRFQSSDINVTSGAEYLALHKISAESRQEDKMLRKANELYVEYEPIAIIFSDGTTLDEE